MDATEVSDCFPLNGDAKNPEIHTIDEVIRIYDQNSKNIKLLGPTRFAQVIAECKKIVEGGKNPKMFHILMILTDGEIHDLKETIDEIADISKRNLPLSIVIVGLGDEEFSNMVRLDGDELAIRAGVKDIVQFLKMNEVVKRSRPEEVNANLAALVLEEIPGQMIQHFKEKGMYPA